MMFSLARWTVVFFCICASLNVQADDQIHINPWPDPAEVGRGIGSKWSGVSTTFEVTGGLGVADNVYVDGDTNDVNTTFVPNNGNDGYQELFTPFNLVGYVTLEPTGGEAYERFATESDEIDVYLVPLRKDEPITLRIADYQAETNDLDLYLYDANDVENPVDSSITVAQEESVRAPYDGQFFIVVSSYSGRSNYLLQSDREPIQQANSLTVSDNFVPDQVIVGLNFQSKLTTVDNNLNSTITQEIEKQHKLKRISYTADGSYLYSITDPLVVGKGAFPLSKYGFGIEDIRKWLVIEKSKSLLAMSNIEFAGPNYYAYNFAEPNDPSFPLQWHYQIIRLPNAWDVTTGSRDVVVAVIDTGVAPHPDLIANVDYDLGRDLVPVNDGSGDGDGYDFYAADPGCEYRPVFCNSHGTHVAGTVGASTNNGVGVAGVNWTTTIMPIRVFGIEPGSTTTCWREEQALRWAGRLPNESGTIPARKADIVNMSLGGPSPCSALPNVINQLRAGGTIVIAAAGNDSSSVPNYPASFNGVISVSATTPLDTLAIYSSYGSNIDIAAPGGDGNGGATDVGSTAWYAPTHEELRFGYLYSPGTSMAAPHVAGVAALMKSVYPEMTPNDFDMGVSGGEITDDLAKNGPKNKDPEFGWGRINALKAVNWAYEMQNGNSPATFPVASSSVLDFGSQLSSLNIAFSKSGPADITLVEYSRDYAWISLEAIQVDQNNFGTYQVIVDRTNLERGTYFSTLTVRADNDSTVEVGLYVQIGDSIPGEAGAMYASLFDSETFEDIGYWAGRQGGNGYALSFSDMPPGSYLLMVGSDADADFFFCDEGEFCAMYQIISNPKLIQVIDSNIELGYFTISAPAIPLESGQNAKLSIGNDIPDYKPASKTNWSEFREKTGRGFPIRK